MADLVMDGAGPRALSLIVSCSRNDRGCSGACESWTPAAAG
jgi:hypothetical protein